MKQLASSCCVSVSTMQRQVEFYVRALSRLDECRATVGSGRPQSQAKSAPRSNSRAHSAHEQRAAARARVQVERVTQHKSPVSTRTPAATDESASASTQASTSSDTTHEHLHAATCAGTSAGALRGMEVELPSLADRVSKGALLGSKATAATGTPDSASCPLYQVLRLTDPQLQLDDYRRWRAAFVSKRISRNT